MSEAELGSLREELVERVRDLHPLLARNADDAEQQRRLSDETLKAVIEAGAMRLLVPRSHGGYEAGFRTYHDVLAELGRGGCGATAWYGFILNMDDWLASIMHPDVRDTVYAEGPDTLIACPLTPSPGWSLRQEEGGIRLSGEWGYVSGCHHADWVMAGFPVIDEAGNFADMAVAMLPRSDAGFRDTWDVVGMAGTGSHTLIYDDIFVPENFTLRLSGPLQGQFPHVPESSYMYRADFTAVFWTAVHPVVLGLAQAALDATVERMTTRPKPLTYTFYMNATKSSAVQADVAHAAALIDAAALQSRAAADEIDAQSRRGGPLPVLDRHRQIMRAANVVRMCKEAVDGLLDVQGASAFARSNPIQRIWRDMHTAARHGSAVPGVKAEIFGRTLLGASEQQMTPIQ